MKILKIVSITFGVLFFVGIVFVFLSFSSMKKTSGIFRVLFRRLFSTTTQTTTQPVVDNTPQDLTNVKPATTPNPFGLMIGNPVGPGAPKGTISLDKRIQLAKEFGAIYFRPNAVFTDKRWTGTCGDCDAALAGGLKLVLTIRNEGGLGSGPSHYPKDINAYKKTVGEIVDKYKPAVLVVENEENSKALFYDGSPSEYNQELKAACEVAHSKGVKCSNGGIVSSLTAFLVADSYKMAGDEKKANDYLLRTLRKEQYQQFQKLGWSNSKFSDQVQRGKDLISGYKASGSDFINFHWYIADTAALEEAVKYLEAKTGLPAMTNEIGQQQNEDPKQVANVMQKIVDLKLPFAVWYSIDTYGLAGARALQNPDGSLRPNGEVFKSYIDKAF